MNIHKIINVKNTVEVFSKIPPCQLYQIKISLTWPIAHESIIFNTYFLQEKRVMLHKRFNTLQYLYNTLQIQHTTIPLTKAAEERFLK